MKHENQIKSWSVNTREWRWVLLIWSCLALFDASQTSFVMHAQGMHHNWSTVVLFRYSAWLVWMLATPFVLRLMRRFSLSRAWPIHLLACVVIGLLSASWDAFIEMMLDPWNQNSPSLAYQSLWFSQFFNSMLSDLVIYITILAIGYGLESRLRLLRHEAETARLNTRLAQAQLDALRRQIEPHFLFNTLNTVTGLMRENKNAAAISMVVGIGDLLRRVLDDSNRHLITLGEELGFLEKYFAIQAIRFGERLSVSIDVPEQLLSISLPGMILQPLVENAFKHGLVHRAQGGAIRIGASCEADRLTLSIYNEGPSLPAAPVEGIGYLNTRERLTGHYGDRFSLGMHNRDNGVEVLLSIPVGSDQT